MARLIDNITIRPVTSWIDTSSEYDHVMISNVIFANTIVSGQESGFNNYIIDKIFKETGLKHKTDYIITSIISPSYDISAHVRLDEVKLSLRFKGAETYTLFKLKYYD